MHRGLASLPKFDPAVLAALPPEKRRELWGLLEHRLGGETFAEFIERVAPDEPPPRHLRPLIDVVERARREPVRACISMPPRHGKTRTLIRAIAWWLSRSPADTCAYASYSERQAWSKSLLARQDAVAAGIALHKSKQAADEWRTLTWGGLVATGVGGPLTGKGVTGLVVIDDPFKNPQEANSQLIRDNVWEWFWAVPMTRLEGPASVIVLHTRWHEDDLIGRLAKMSGWQVINLPAIAETPEPGQPPDPLGRAPGESLWPERFPVEKLEEIQSAPDIGPFVWSALYQGRPRRRGAKVFSEIVPRFRKDTFDRTGCSAIIGADPAASKKTTADYSVAVLWVVRGHGATSQWYAWDVLRGQWLIPEFARELRTFQNKHFNGVPIWVEAVAGFKAVPQILIDGGAKLVHEAPVMGDKFQRAQPLAKAWNEGRVFLPESAPWLEAFLAEFAAFSGVNDAHDDQVDAAAHAYNAVIMTPTPPARGSVPSPSAYGGHTPPERPRRSG
jgi:predicted phage terminase large subunit-like protein